MWTYNSQESKWKELQLRENVRRSTAVNLMESTLSSMTGKTNLTGASITHNGQKNSVLGRIGHSFTTMKVEQKTLSNGSIMTTFVTYIFGGLIQNQYGQLQTTNDLFALKTQRIMNIAKAEADTNDKSQQNFDGPEEVTYTRLVPKDGRLPIPRRAHSAILIKQGKYLVVFGGKNDNSAELGSKLSFTALNDFMLFDTEKKLWSFISQ